MRNFIKKVFKFLLTALFAYAVLFVFAFLAFLAVVAAFSSKPPQVKPGTVLVLDLGFVMTDRPAEDNPLQILLDAINETESRALHLRAALMTVEEAARDRNIVALLIKGNVPSVSYASSYPALRELRQAIQRFGENKPVYAFIDMDGMRDLYLKTAATQVIAHPRTLLDFRGFRSESLYLGEAMQRLGIEFESIALKDFKTFGEIFERTEMSDEERLQRTEILNGLWQTIAAEIADSRGMTVADLDQIANSNLILYGDKLTRLGLVDQLMDFADLEEALIEIGQWDDAIESFRQFDFVTYAKRSDLDFNQLINAISGENKVALIYLEGPVVFGRGGQNAVGDEDIKEALEEVRRNAQIKAAVIRINSPGGSSLASERIAHEIRKTNKVKPVIVSMGGMAASAGYQAAAEADFIFTEAATITGSIGVFAQTLNFKPLADRWSLFFDGVETHDFAGSFLPTRRMRDDERKQWVAFASNLYTDFVAGVAQGRNMSIDDVEAIAKGRVWMGDQAVELGLADEIGGLRDALQMAANKAGLGSSFQVTEFPRVRTLEERLADMFSSRTLAFGQRIFPDRADRVIRRLEQELAFWSVLNDPNDLYFVLPFTLDID